jgi:hypothetical protein
MLGLVCRPRNAETPKNPAQPGRQILEIYPFEGICKEPLVVPTDRFDPLLEAGRFCLRKAYLPRRLAMRMHLFAEELRDHRPIQLGLFDHLDENGQAVATLKRQVNQRYGRFVLRSGATLPLHAIYQDRANSYDICDVRGKTCF